MRLGEALVTASKQVLRDSWFSPSAIWVRVTESIPVSVLAVFAIRAILLPGVLPIYMLETILFSIWASHFELFKDVFLSKEMKLVLYCIAALVKLTYPYFQVFLKIYCNAAGQPFFSNVKGLGCTSIPLGFQKSVSVCSVLSVCSYFCSPSCF